jgi:hypothetical protein
VAKERGTGRGRGGVDRGGHEPKVYVRGISRYLNRSAIRPFGHSAIRRLKVSDLFSTVEERDEYPKSPDVRNLFQNPAFKIPDPMAHISLPRRLYKILFFN